MTPGTFGWAGKILKINLSCFEISELETMHYADRFLGGRGIATRIYWEEVGRDVGAFDPENHLILMTGPLGATGAQGASRFAAVSKSPMLMPEAFCYGNLGCFRHQGPIPFTTIFPRTGQTNWDDRLSLSRSSSATEVTLQNGQGETLPFGSIYRYMIPPMQASSRF